MVRVRFRVRFMVVVKGRVRVRVGIRVKIRVRVRNLSPRSGCPLICSEYESRETHNCSGVTLGGLYI